MIFLFRDVAPYHVHTFRAIDRQKIKSIVYYFDARYSVPTDLVFVKFKLVNSRNLIIFDREEILITAGYSNILWSLTAFLHRLRGGKVKFTSDTIYNKEKLSHRLYSLIGKYIFPVIFNEILVAGPKQAEFGRMLGFGTSQIRLGCYSARTSARYTNEILSDSVLRFIFIGRFAPEKGILEFIDIMINYSWNRNITFDLYGFGPLEEKIEMAINSNINENIELRIMGKLNPINIDETLKKYNFLVLPSKFEPWGVVVHEAIVNGVVPLVSCHVGSGELFVSKHSNGFVFKDYEDLMTIFRRLDAITNEGFKSLSDRSILASAEITPEIVAQNFVT